MITKSDLLAALEFFDDEAPVLVSDGHSWCHVDFIEQVGDCPCISISEYHHGFDD